MPQRKRLDSMHHNPFEDHTVVVLFVTLCASFLSNFYTLSMSLTFPHYERAKVHPQNKAVQEMILGGSNLALS